MLKTAVLLGECVLWTDETISMFFSNSHQLCVYRNIEEAYWWFGVVLMSLALSTLNLCRVYHGSFKRIMIQSIPEKAHMNGSEENVRPFWNGFNSVWILIPSIICEESWSALLMKSGPTFQFRSAEISCSATQIIWPQLLSTKVVLESIGLRAPIFLSEKIVCWIVDMKYFDQF